MDKSLCMCAMMLVWTYLGADGQFQVGFSLDGVQYLNGSTVLREDIGEGAKALLCTTDRMACCDLPNRAGEFYFPDNARVPVLSQVGTVGYYRDRGDQLIGLNRQLSGAITGRFRCEIPTGTDTTAPNSMLFINIVDISASITESGNNIAGEIYSLVCSVTVTGSTEQPTITWLDSMNNQITSGVVTTGSISTLMFSPLAASHAGTYTCRATLGSAEMNGSTEVSLRETPTTEAPTTTEAPITTEASTTMVPTSEVPTSTTESPTTPSIYLSLKDVVYTNNSAIQITEIGETDPDSSLNEGLQCITDRMLCCQTPPNRAGEWYFPNGTVLPPVGSAASFYRNRGDDRTVNLNRLNSNILSPTGLFCCVVPDATDAVQIVCADIVNIHVVITSSGNPTAGDTYSLDCSVNGMTDPAAIYKWFDGNGTQLANISQLQFSPLRASESGAYTCRATVRGVVVEETAIVTVNFSTPTTVSVTPPMGVIIAGSSPILTCIVELSLLVDVPVNVTTEWTGPGETMFLQGKMIPAVIVNLTTYTSTVTVDVARNGSYICEAAINSGGTTSGSTIITVAPLPPPTNLVATPMTTSIRLTWNPPGGTDDVPVNSYEINYEYSVIQCSGEGGSFPPITIRMIDGSLREYTIENSTITPVEEESKYNIILRAVNPVDTSEPSNIARATTTIATPGLPSSLIASSISVSSITIQWDPVPCQDRNRPFSNYRITYYPSSDPNAVDDMIYIVGESNRMFPHTLLPPRTNYTFEVQAFDLRSLVPGLPATLIVSTSEPSSLGFLLDGVLYPNNSVVTVTDIGSSFFMSALFCLTPSLECCSDSETPNVASVTREWYLPDGRPVSSAGTVFSREQVSSVVSLYRSGSTSLSGVFRCEIPDASGNSQNIYIGIYPQGVGSPSITSVVFDRNSTTLTCTSTGGPPTTVVWKKNNILVNTSIYEQSQRLIFTENSTYENALFNSDIANFVGSFTCEVSNARDSDSKTVMLNGVTITRDPFTVGQSATARCISDTLATRIEWLNEENVVVTSTTSTKQLNLVFTLVSDSIHNQIFVCRVTRDGGMVAMQNLTVDVDVPSSAVTASVSSSGIARAGMIYNLTCTVSKTVGGLVNSPTATWTTGGVAVTNGTDIITIITMANDTVAFSTLTFDPLKTSHGAQYRCSGFFMSPARDTAFMPYVEEVLYVQISTPDVIITVPPGPLFAGSIAPLTLTCNISINSATDTDVAVMDTDVMWMRGNTPLSDGDARVTISAVSGSRPSFTSILTLHPLSTADNSTFTCMARARRPVNQQSFITDSEMGERTELVVVNLPSPPTVMINPFNGVALAGASHRVFCSVIVQDGIMESNNTLTVMWTRGDGGMLLSVGESFGSHIFLSPVRTSHGGQYTCTTRLNIPEAGVDVSGANTTSISIQFVPPPPIISGSPRNTSFFQGLDLTFTCSITLGGVVDTPVTVQGIWNRNGTELMDGDENGRVAINNPPMSSPPYQITLRFNPLNVTDAGTYECGVMVTPVDTTFIATATTSNSRNISSIAGFPTQLVDVTDEGISTAGFSGYTLICNTSREPDLPSASTLAVKWLDPRGNIITSGTNFSIFGDGPTTDVSLMSSLIFSSLYTSQAGEYTCRTLQNIPGTVVNHPESMTFTIQVKLPAPISPLTFRRSRNSTLNAGTSFSLTCIITPNTTGVDTDLIVQSIIMGPGISDTNRVSVFQPVPVGENTFETTVMFNHLLEADTGTYSCLAVITSPPSQPNVIANHSASGSESITVGPLQAPVVTISPIQIPTAGDQHILTCTAIVDEYLIAAPALEWRFPVIVAGVSTGAQSIIGSTSTITLSFNGIRTSQGGVYRCKATINVTGFEPLSQTANQIIQVRIPPPSVSILDPLALPYNGTVFTVTGAVELDQSVDTAITVSGIWSNNNGVYQETTSPPLLTNLTFRPLATNSSGLYTLTGSVRPSENSPYIIGNTGSTSYTLAVRPLPSQPPTIAVVSRQSLDECGEVMTLNCSTNQVQNLFSPPIIIWIAPDGREISTVESNDPRMDPQTGQLIFSDVTTNNRGQYTCRAILNIPEAQIDNYYDEDMVQVNTNLPGIVQNLVCTRSSSPSELSFSWNLPTQLGNEVVSYQVMVNRLRHRPGTRDVIQSSVYEEFVEMKDASVTGLVAEVPYNVTVKALSLAGCGREQQIYCFTWEGVPPPPENVVVVRFDSTSIGVSWTKFTLVELKGLANYFVTYSIIIGSRKRQSPLGDTVTVPWTQNQVIISGLQPGAEYDVTVRTSTAVGMSVSAGPSIAAPSSSSDSMVAIISGVVAVVVVLIIVIAATIVVVIALILRNRRAEFKPNQRPMPYEQPGVMLSDLSPTNKERELYETIEADHEYEILDKYNQAYEDVKVPPTKPKPEAEAVQPLSSTGDYEFTQCPAYISVVTTSIHGNTNKPMDTPPVQPTSTHAVQDESK